MERPGDIRARVSSKSHAAETPRESHRQIYQRTRSRQRQLHLPLPLREPPQANREIPPAFVVNSPRATACEDELADNAWPIRGVADVVLCVPEKQAGHSRRIKFLKYSRSSLLSNVMQRKSESK